MFFVMLSANLHQLMLCTTSRYVSPIRFHVSPSLHMQWDSTPLLIAAQVGHAEVAHFLLENGSSVQEQSDVS